MLPRFHQAQTEQGAPPHLIRGFYREDLAVLFGELGYRVGAEIGTAEGRFAEVLCKANPRLKLYCVDPWAPYAERSRQGRRGPDTGAKMEQWYRTARATLEIYQAILIRGKSADVEITEPLDFAYIDANHSYPFVLEDLHRWSARVRSGGIIAGHDYYEFEGGGVIQAVCEFTAAQHITDWWLTDARPLRRHSDPHGPSYREHSYFWIKP